MGNLDNIKVANISERRDNSISELIGGSVNTPGVDLVNHPPHYNAGKYEHCDVVVDQNWDYFISNCTKYFWRMGKKDPSKLIEDLEKAEWYLHRKIQLLKWPTLTAKQADKVEVLIAEGMTQTDAIVKVNL